MRKLNNDDTLVTNTTDVEKFNVNDSNDTSSVDILDVCNNEKSIALDSIEGYCFYNKERKKSENVANCTGYNLPDASSPQAVPVIFAPIVLTPALIEVGKWFGLKIGKWALGQALKELKNFLFPSSDPQAALDQLRRELEAKFETRLSNDKLNQLQATYRGFQNYATLFIQATQDLEAAKENWLYDQNSATEEAMNKARELVFVRFESLHGQLVVWMPQFEIPNYEEIALPLFAQMVNLHLTHLKDGILKGADWGFTAEKIRIYTREFIDLIREYTNRARDAFNRGFTRIQRNSGIGMALNYRAAMNVYLFDFVYNWSLLRYEGIVPTVSRNLYHYIGNNDNPTTHMDGLMKIIVGVPNERARLFHLAVYFRPTNVPWPITATETQFPEHGNMGWVGNRSAANNTPVHYFNTNQDSFENRVQGKVLYPSASRWDLSIQNNRMLVNDYLSNDYRFDIKYDDHFIRTVSSHPGHMENNPSYSLADKTGFQQNRNTPSNIIVGFAPNNTKKFYANRLHTLSTRISTAIPAIHYNRLTSNQTAYFDSDLGNGVDGSLILAKIADAAYYKLNLEQPINQRFCILVRIQAGSPALELRLGNEGQSDYGPTLPLSLLSEHGVSGYYDYITSSFLVDGRLKKELKVTNMGGNPSGLKYNQLIFVPANDFKQLIK
ncbi:insecticidal delta-endotoxin Cry8Ea1 family protein [Bacillus thuringiensis]|uniref:insecticidal delta-endotoxin Cry8Ea1 family protein n=1 Tax=Bacillus thuringiensis TaxID=1428 RepID=UPI000E477187|nr:insecticidal delta-endotoxin Cry8Ea1 family protein [Bacillus thuringiensis]MDZ3953603.1 insecticidal delta-endotoxin Cry8Ea1 family protein [Bacillus thuringiensis]RGP50528.1 hypothetical protein BTW32_15410 [Bacillus thuringiensis]